MLNHLQCDNGRNLTMPALYRSTHASMAGLTDVATWRFDKPVVDAGAEFFTVATIPAQLGPTACSPPV